MRIYTRTGDDGTTGLFGGGRVAKTDARVEAYGTVDETNAAIGMARALGLPPELDRVLAEVASDLFTIGAELACVPGREGKLKMALMGPLDAERLEHAIDAAQEGLPELRAFVLPGGTQGSAALHVARCVARRAERAIVRASGETPVRREIIVYMNRLSDLLFAMARRANHDAGATDIPWKPRAASP